MSLAIVAAMSAAVACSCCNNSKKAEAAEEPAQVECCGDTTKCADCPHNCDSTATNDTVVVAE